MKTYSIAALLLVAFSFVSCEKSEVETTKEVSETFTANYTVISKNNNRLNTQLLGSTESSLTLKSEVSAFIELPSNSLKYRTADRISYFSTENCTANLQIYRPSSDETVLYEVFSDLDVCDIQVTAITHTNDYVALSYIQELAGKNFQYTVRFISLTEETPTFTEVTLDKKPVRMVSSTNRLFVLTVNEFVTDEYHMSVINSVSNEILIELDLGFDANSLFTNKAGEVIIGYPELHTTLNPSTLVQKYTVYADDTAPGFESSNDFFMDAAGKLFFQKTVLTAEINIVPATYDFVANNTVVYLYENFLTEAQMNVAFDIKATTTLGFDAANNIMLIGYEKKGTQQTGGILRVTPAPDFKLIDNTDLEGIPQAIFVD
ncbi:MAG: hypothetical protein WA810_01915 [Maribacter sp.]